MNLHSPLDLHTHLQVLSVICLAMGLGWVFSEVRRHCLDREDSNHEEWQDEWRGRATSFCTGAVLAFIGAVGIFRMFGFGAVHFSPHSQHMADVDPLRYGQSYPSDVQHMPYVAPPPFGQSYPSNAPHMANQTTGLALALFFSAADHDTLRFLEIFGGGMAVWLVISFLSVGFLPSPLFGEKGTAVLCALVRGVLLLLWLSMFYFDWGPIAARLQQGWKQEALLCLVALLPLAQILKGSLIFTEYTRGFFSSTWEIPAITLEERPFPYLAAVLAVMLGLFILLSEQSPGAVAATFLGS
jgi:hypothetical protein